MDPPRRPIRARQTQWAAAIARGLVRIGLRPNTISILSSVFAAGAAAAFVISGGVDSPWGRAAALVAAAAGIQLRLLCNLFDGMVAVEGGFRTKSGEIYNELPDRFSDAMILAGAGYSVPALPWLDDLGWTAAVLAVTTAYVRALGVSAGASQQFVGPMAKPHRMAAMTCAALGAAAGDPFGGRGMIIAAGLSLVAVGCLWTIARRCRRIVRELEER